MASPCMLLSMEALLPQQNQPLLQTTTMTSCLHQSASCLISAAFGSLLARTSKIVELAMAPEIVANTDVRGVQLVKAGTCTVAIGGVGKARRVEDGAVVALLKVHGEDAKLFSMPKLQEQHAKLRAN
eukprot:SAG31_NODE_3620_length_4061_cov_2.042403_2_plen_127_part_00